MTQFHLLTLTVHVNLHETRLPIFIITIAFNTIYILVLMQKRYFIL